MYRTNLIEPSTKYKCHLYSENLITHPDSPCAEDLTFPFNFTLLIVEISKVCFLSLSFYVHPSQFINKPFLIQILQTNRKRFLFHFNISKRFIMNSKIQHLNLEIKKTPARVNELIFRP